MKIKTKNKQKNLQSLKAILIAIAIIAFWRGVWGLMDMYLFPDNLFLSHVFSIILGIGILASTHYLIKELMG